MQILFNLSQQEVEEALIRQTRERFSLTIPNHNIRCSQMVHENGTIMTMVVVAENQPAPDEPEIEETPDEIEPVSFIHAEEAEVPV